MRKSCFDVLKGFAITAVVLYHMGICTYGYLGVDVFFVIAGFFTLKSLLKTEDYNWTYFFKFLRLRLLRLLPLLLVACVACVLWGLYFMLPDDYENLCESVVATSFFSNNILSCITTSNYWDVVNEYKPLMHTWYVGVLMQYYIVFSLIFILVHKWAKDKSEKLFNIVLYGAAVISLLLYILQKNEAPRFYYLQYRFFEFCLGGLVFVYYEKHYNSVKSGKGLSIAITASLYVALFILVFLNTDWHLIPQVRLILVCLLSAFLLFILPIASNKTQLFSPKVLALLGKCSFSIFIWHQILLAFIRYSFTDNIYSIKVLFLYLIILAILTILSYKFIETLPNKRKVFVACGLLFIIINAFSLYVYANAGVTRDVPELGIYKGQQRRGMHAAYNDRGYEYDRDFVEDNREKWLVIGNSFGRDWVNIILESSIKDSVDVSYMEDAFINNGVSNDNKALYMINNADVVFYSSKGINENKIEYLKRNYIPVGKRLYIVGEKNFGKSNGIIYRHRNEPDYHNMTIKMEEGYEERNDTLSNKYSDSYIDMIAIVRQSNGEVRVFDDDGKFISQDCRHLTQAGARFYSYHVNMPQLLMESK